MIKEHFYGETTPAGTTPAGTTPAGTTPAGTTPAGTTPLDTLKLRYNNNTTNNIKLYRQLDTIRLTKGQNKEHISKNHNNINDRTDKRETNKRLVEIKLNKDRQTYYILNVLKMCIIIIGCLLVIPILVKLKILKKMFGLGIFVVCVLVIICVILYFSYFKNYNRDVNNFSKFNFKNPDSKEIAKSKINVDLSESDQARCQAFSEIQADFDPDTVQLSMDKYLTKTKAVTDTCSL